MHLHPSDLARPLAALAAAAVLSATLAGCSGSDEESKAKPSGVGSQAADPSEQVASVAPDPNSPFVVAASAVAERSRDQVTQLHVMGAATTGTGAASDLPVKEIPHLAGAIGTELDRQITDSTMMAPPKGSPAADLVTSLRGYHALATDLAAWEPDAGPMPDAWFDRLTGTDRHWKKALRKLGELSDRDLLADLPPLILPS